MTNFKVFYTRQAKSKLQYDVLSAATAVEAEKQLENLAKMMRWKNVQVVRVSETTMQPIS